MVAHRSDNCLSCFFYDYHRLQSLGQVTFPLENPTLINSPQLADSITQLQAANPTLTFSIVFSIQGIGALPTPLQIQQAYFPMVFDHSNFQIAAVPNGPAIVISSPGTAPIVTADLCIMGCHRDEPQSSLSSQSGQPQRATWQPVDPDYWCGSYLTAYATTTIAGYQSASATSNTVSNSALLSFVVGTGLAYQAGTRARFTSRSTGAFMEGVVTSYTSLTGAITVQMDTASGGGTLTDWNVNLSGQPGVASVPALSVNTQTANYAAVIGDANNIVEMNVAGANTFTVPPNSSVAFPVGTTITVTQLGAGVTTITAGGGVTILSRNGLRTAGQNAVCMLYQRAANIWVLGGDTQV